MIRIVSTARRRAPSRSRSQPVDRLEAEVVGAQARPAPGRRPPSGRGPGCPRGLRLQLGEQVQPLSASRRMSSRTATGRTRRRTRGPRRGSGREDLEPDPRGLLVEEQVDGVVLDDEHGERSGRAPRDSGRLGSSARGRRGGSTAKNVEPTPGSLRTETLPPSSSASFRDSGRPEPGPLDPPLERALDLAELLEDPLAGPRRRSRSRCRPPRRRPCRPGPASAASADLARAR